MGGGDGDVCHTFQVFKVLLIKNLAFPSPLQSVYLQMQHTQIWTHWRIDQLIDPTSYRKTCWSLQESNYNVCQIESITFQAIWSVL